MEIAPGAFHLPRYLALDAQKALADSCRALMDGAVPAYVPTVRRPYCDESVRSKASR